MNNYLQHQNQLNETTLFIQKKLPKARFYSRHVGQFYSKRILFSLKAVRSIQDLKMWLKTVKNKYTVTINKPGMCDQYVIYPMQIKKIVIPIHIEIETKSGSGKLSPDQIWWKNICEKNGIPHITARNPEQAYGELLNILTTIYKELSA